MEEHTSNIESRRHVDALVFGGSNSVYSLSAGQLEEVSGKTWYNASIHNEGFSDRHFRKWVDDVVSVLDAEQVSLVVYSTISPFRTNRFDERADFSGDVGGRMPLTIKPRTSAWSAFTQIVFEGGMLRSKDYPLPTRYGDMDFDGFDCGAPDFEKKTFQQDTIEASSQSLTSMTAYYLQAFPNAHLAIVLPSEYYAQPEDISRHGAFVESLFAKVSRDFSEMESIDANRVSLIQQPPYPDIEWLCDSAHHANAQGRVLRTDDLYQRIATYLPE
jgi:hypothetical protein